MLLWNTSKATLEGKFDGHITVFKPQEKVTIYDRAAGLHLIYKLSTKGLVELPDTNEMRMAAVDSEELRPFLIKGLTERRKTLDFVVQNFRVKNKERESAKLAAEPADDHTINCVKEIKAIDELMKTLRADDYNLVEDYLGSKNQSVKDADDDIKNSARGVERKGSSYELTGSSKPAAAVTKPAPQKAAPKAKAKVSR